MKMIEWWVFIFTWLYFANIWVFCFSHILQILMFWCWRHASKTYSSSKCLDQQNKMTCFDPKCSGFESYDIVFQTVVVFIMKLDFFWFELSILCAACFSLKLACCAQCGENLTHILEICNRYHLRYTISFFFQWEPYCFS